jgi:hypothetical protein
MARRRYSRSRGGFGFGGSMMGAVKKAGMGAVAGLVLGTGILGLGAGFLVGGIPGAAGAFLSPQIKNALGGVTGQVPYGGGLQ